MAIPITDADDARKQKLIETLWVDPSDRPDYAGDMTLDELINAACVRLAINRCYLERKTDA